ncbi:TPA: hypothetical protein PXN16_004215 [Yersinia enterocolitica]|nr:hypothetical protein [Yersinia enterocolitica]
MISTQKTREEKWLPVHGYEEFYAVSSSCIKSGKETVMHGAKDMRANGFTDSLVYRCINGKLKHHKKHTFRRVDADI